MSAAVENAAPAPVADAPAAVDNVAAPAVAEEKPAVAEEKPAAGEDKTVADNVATNAAAVADNSAITPAPPAETPKPAVIDITSKAQFEELVKETPYVALQAHASWCGPCKAISPLFKTWATGLIEHQSTYTFARFDTDDVEDLAMDLQIRSIPAFFFFEKGETTPAKTFTGAHPKALKELVDTYAAKAKESAFSTSEDF